MALGNKKAMDFFFFFFKFSYEKQKEAIFESLVHIEIFLGKFGKMKSWQLED